MLLRTLISQLEKVTTSGALDLEIDDLTADSRAAEPGKLFAAIRGTSMDGHKFIADVIAKGATAILAESAPPSDFPQTAAWLHVPDSRAALAVLSATFYGEPAGELKMAGITGTNGKTTTAFLVHHIMRTAWHRAGLLGTILVDDGETRTPAKHTTPGSIELNAILATFRDNACRGAAMEVSSHGIHQKRVHHIAFDAAGLRFPPTDLRASLAQQLLLLEAAQELATPLERLPHPRVLQPTMVRSEGTLATSDARA